MSIKNNRIISTIPEIIQEIQAKKPIVVVDSEERENEGDIVFSAEDCTPDKVNFMVTHGKGLVCVPIIESIAQKLKFNPMVEVNRDNYRTAFTVSVDAVEGTTTGISAYDRYKTIQKIADENSTENDFRSPGHIFPLVAKNGGVLERAGHTEASIDIMKLANKKSVAVICEIIKEDGNMARMDDLILFAKKFQIKICTIENLIQYRIQRESLLKEIISTNIESEYGPFTLKIFQNTIDNKKHIALVKGEIKNIKSNQIEEPIHVRVHTESLLEDVFQIHHLSNSPLIKNTLQFLQKQKKGIFLYLIKDKQEYTFLYKLRKYMDLKKSTCQEIQKKETQIPLIDRRPNQTETLREYGIGAQILRALNVKNMILITKYPKHIVGLEGYDLNIVKTISL